MRTTVPNQMRVPNFWIRQMPVIKCISLKVGVAAATLHICTLECRYRQVSKYSGNSNLHTRPGIQIISLIWSLMCKVHICTPTFYASNEKTADFAQPHLKGFKVNDVSNFQKVPTPVNLFDLAMRYLLKKIVFTITAEKIESNQSNHMTNMPIYLLLQWVHAWGKYQFELKILLYFFRLIMSTSQSSIESKQLNDIVVQI